MAKDKVRCFYCGKHSKTKFCCTAHAAAYAERETEGLKFCHCHTLWHREQCALCRVEAYAQSGQLRPTGKDVCGIYHSGYLTPCTLPVKHAGWHVGHGVSWMTGGFRIDATGMAYNVP